jgi:hypothetical protein
MVHIWYKKRTFKKNKHCPFSKHKATTILIVVWTFIVEVYIEISVVHYRLWVDDMIFVKLSKTLLFGDSSLSIWTPSYIYIHIPYQIQVSFCWDTYWALVEIHLVVVPIIAFLGFFLSLTLYRICQAIMFYRVLMMLMNYVVCKEPGQACYT